jgi:hypothetical protein
MGSLAGCVWDAAQGNSDGTTTEWAWRLIGGAELRGMELPLWAESVWSCNGGLWRRTGGMDGWWMGKKRKD